MMQQYNSNNNDSYHNDSNNMPHFTAHVKPTPTTFTTLTIPSLSSSRQSLSKPPTHRARTLAALVVVLLVVLGLLALASFVFGFGYSNGWEATKRVTIPSRAQRLSEAAVDEQDNGRQFVDSQPSGFQPNVDYILDYGPIDADADSDHSVAVGPPEAHFIASSADVSPEMALELMEKLRKQHPELFVEETPVDATAFGIEPIDTANAWFDDWEGDDEQTINDPIDVLDGEDFLVDPPSGKWEDLETPSPIVHEKPIKITFQETEDVPQWEGPPGATWFRLDAPIDVLSTTESRVSAEWMGEGCVVVSDKDGQHVEGGDKCGGMVWYPFHYDVYPNSAASDWEYIDMKDGPRTHAWPGAGPFRKIQMQTGIVGREGPICFDLPAKPENYHGVEPDELDCSLYLSRVSGFGDDQSYTEVTTDSAEEQLTEWWFQWRRV